MAEQFVLDLSGPEPPSFDNFVAGANREALSTLQAVACAKSRESGVLLWGAQGAGKSHLLRAAASAAAHVRFVVEREKAQGLPSTGDVPPSTLLVVDRVDEADASAQGTLFTLLNHLATNGGQWIATAALPPARLALREDLRTRIALGLVFEITPLADDDKAKALEAYARERGFRLSSEVIAYLLAHGRRDMPSLVATLAALDRHSLATQRAVSVPLIRDWLQRDLGLTSTPGRS